MSDLRSVIRDAHCQPQFEALNSRDVTEAVSPETRKAISARAIGLIETVRSEKSASMMELFLGEYGLSADEGVALMCLAEALLRVPDAQTMDALIEDKIAPAAWSEHLGRSHSALVNVSTWALFLTGKVLKDSPEKSIAGTLHGAIKRLGEPVIRTAVGRVMRELGRQFVLGESIERAHQNARKKEVAGFTYSYDMLGEAALTQEDALGYFTSYRDAIDKTARVCTSSKTHENPSISVKLSALHPRYEPMQRERVIEELGPRVEELAVAAMKAGMGFTIDAEESGRLDLSLDIIDRLLTSPEFNGWDGLGVVVQAYHQRSSHVLDWLYDRARSRKRPIAIRLVKGAYWDTEIKHAQVEGFREFPVLTDKAATDVNYILCAQKLLGMTDWVFPQFAIHNAHTMSATLELAPLDARFEFQRLHGMGVALHEIVREKHHTPCRIYAPVGAHRDLLAYLVRRLLENGANSSFVNQIADPSVPASVIAADPFIQYKELHRSDTGPAFANPCALYGDLRRNSAGWDLEDPIVLAHLRDELSRLSGENWSLSDRGESQTKIVNPSTGEKVGEVDFLSSDAALKLCAEVKPWTENDTAQRAEILRKAADLFDDNTLRLMSLLQREAGKTIADCVGEIREAVDFLRFYAAQAEQCSGEPAGVFACISPWNFPLAIFTGQIAAALATGNGVIAKPAEATPIIADYAVGLLKKAGVPDESLKLAIGTGAEVGSVLTANPNIGGVCFTGSTATARRIHRSMAENLAPHAPLIAETGGLNAMIVDSTALPEQAVKDVIASAFQSAGQRCSALRILYVQDEIYAEFVGLLTGAMAELRVGNPADFATDIGPVIDVTAQSSIQSYIDQARSDGRLLKQLPAPKMGTFVGPALISVSGIGDLTHEVFGPVLHVASFKASGLSNVLEAINEKGFGLTFGLHSRINDRVQTIVDTLRVGNIYVNRNQIGAVVESQPFGGEGLSGTGQKAGGPNYIHRFLKTRAEESTQLAGRDVTIDEVATALSSVGYVDRAKAIETLTMPGPTGESNQLTTYPRRSVLCLGPTASQAREQLQVARSIGCHVVGVAPGLWEEIDGVLEASALTKLDDVDVVMRWAQDNRDYRVALSRRNGPIIPLLSSKAENRWLKVERHVCVDTTAAGGNAALLS